MRTLRSCTGFRRVLHPVDTEWSAVMEKMLGSNPAIRIHPRDIRVRDVRI